MLNIQPSTIQRAQGGEQSAKLSIIAELQPMIRMFKFSKRFPESWRDDVEQTCKLAILIAITKFDIIRGKNITFESFAKQIILTELTTLYNTCIHPCNLPTKVRREYMALLQAEKKGKIDKMPTVLSNGIKIADIEVFMGMCEPNRELSAEFEKNYL